MKKSDWAFLAVAALIGAAIWWFFLRKSAPARLAATTTAAEPNQNHVVGSSMVEPDAQPADPSYYTPDLSSLYP